MIVGEAFLNASSIGYMVFESDSDSVCGYAKFYTEGKYRVGLPAVFKVNSGDIYLSHIASTKDWTTGISIVNTTATSKELTIEFDNGTILTKAIASGEHQAFTVRSLFWGAPRPDIHSAVIRNGDGIVGLELFGNTDAVKDSRLSGILLSDETATVLYFPHIASNSKWSTGVVAYNPSASACSITVNPYTADGTSLKPVSFSIPGHGKYVGTVANLGLPSQTAWFALEASSPVTGFELFGTSDGNQLSEYAGVALQGKTGIFPKLEHDGWTGIAFVNVGSSHAIVTLTAYDDRGNTVATDKMILKPHEKVLGLAETLFAKDIQKATYLAYTCNKYIIGFQINGSSDSRMSDGLPAMRGGVVPTRGKVNLPSRVLSESISIYSATDVHPVDKDGFFGLDKEIRLSPYLVTASVDDVPVGMSFFDPGSTEKIISCEETAVSLVIFNTLLFAVPVHLLSDLVSELRTVTEIKLLADKICLDLSQRNDALVNPGDALRQSLAEASVAAFNTVFNANLPR
jgi:hypothetical protein